MRTILSTITVHVTRRSFLRQRFNAQIEMAFAFSSSSIPSTLQQGEMILKLQELLPEAEFQSNKYELERHGRGESFHPTQAPEVVISPKTVHGVATLLKYANRHLIPVTPFGAGTSVEGHVCCLQGGISLDMKYFQEMQLPATSDDDFMATVGAGVTRNTLNQALRHTGLQFVVDPGADASIGGMIATGASGTTAVRYGTMRENLLQVQAVLADGAIIHTGTKALKNSAGYDLMGLLCGSEGTLGVITQATLKLHPVPEFVSAAVCTFGELHPAAQAVATLKLCDIPLTRCELLDKTSVAAFNAYNPGRDPMPETPTLFLEFQASSEETLQEQIKLTQQILQDCGGSNIECTYDETERKALWSARHSLYYASLRLRNASSAILTDACVPLSKFADLIQATTQDVHDLGVVGPCFGHAGDGNFHCILPVLPDDSEQYISKLHEVNHNLIQRTLQAGGTCTGEHGVGYGKIKYLQSQYGPGAVQMMKTIKQALDPNNIMNPGKVVPME